MNPIQRMQQFWARLTSGSEFLCDTCKYCYGNVCTRPERPNATSCPEYKRAGK